MIFETNSIDPRKFDLLLNDVKYLMGKSKSNDSNFINFGEVIERLEFKLENDLKRHKSELHDTVHQAISEHDNQVSLLLQQISLNQGNSILIERLRK